MKLHAIIIVAFLTTSGLFNPLLAGGATTSSNTPSKPIAQETVGDEKMMAQTKTEKEKEAQPDSPAKAQTTQQQSSQKSGSTDINKPATSQKSAGKYPEDRPWIIKRKTLKDPKARKIKPPIFSWKDQAQKKKCGAYLGQVKEQFLHARYYSIQGDPCASADHAKEFMALVDQCEQECPEDFLPKSGYTQPIVRNLRLINELGTKKCLGRMQLDQGSPAAPVSPAKARPSKAASKKN